MALDSALIATVCLVRTEKDLLAPVLALINAAVEAVESAGAFESDLIRLTRAGLIAWGRSPQARFDHEVLIQSVFLGQGRFQLTQRVVPRGSEPTLIRDAGGGLSLDLPGVDLHEEVAS